MEARAVNHLDWRSLLTSHVREEGAPLNFRVKEVLTLGPTTIYPQAQGKLSERECCQLLGVDSSKQFRDLLWQRNDAMTQVVFDCDELPVVDRSRAPIQQLALHFMQLQQDLVEKLAKEDISRLRVSELMDENTGFEYEALRGFVEAIQRELKKNEGTLTVHRRCIIDNNKAQILGIAFEEYEGRSLFLYLPDSIWTTQSLLTILKGLAKCKRFNIQGAVIVDDPSSQSPNTQPANEEIVEEFCNLGKRANLSLSLPRSVFSDEQIQRIKESCNIESDLSVFNTDTSLPVSKKLIFF